MSVCAVCARPQTADTAVACSRCATDLAGQLTATADLWPELETTCAGQARMSEPGPRARGHAPAQPARPDIGGADQQPGWPVGLPVPLAAVAVRDDVRNTVTTWARVVLQERGGSAPAGTPGLLRWLAGQVEWLRHHPAAAECFDELTVASRRVAPAVDRPAPRVDAGLCLSPTETGPCQQRLSAAPRAAVLHCPACRAVHSAVERSVTILDAAADILGTAVEVSAWLGIHGEPVPVGTVYSWAASRRGRPARLLRRGYDPETGQPRYRLGDVRTLAGQRQPRRERMSA